MREMGVCPQDVSPLRLLIESAERLFVLTGAGVSTASGIPDYRDREGNWKRPQPVQFGDFVRGDSVRRRYWARSLVGWPRFADARPGPAHRALARLEQRGRVHHIVTQNVDRLHQEAGSRKVIDLHGRLDRVECMECGRHQCRDEFQQVLAARNPDFADLPAVMAPDGDADPGKMDFDAFDVPTCEGCGGMLKPSIVFFGESVPKRRVARAFERLGESDAVLVVGSSLMVWSGYRFARAAAEADKPLAIVTLGRTRADDKATLKVEADCGEVLTELTGDRSMPC